MLSVEISYKVTHADDWLAGNTTDTHTNTHIEIRRTLDDYMTNPESKAINYANALEDKRAMLCGLLLYMVT